MEDEAGRAAVAALRDALSGLLAVPLTSLSGADLLELLGDVERELRRTPAFDHAALAEIESRGLARDRAYSSTATLLRDLLRIGSREAGARVRAAADLGPRRDLTGGPLPPILERTAAAQAAGDISAAHARIVCRTVDKLPDAVAVDHDLAVESFLLEQAGQFDPETLAGIARRVLDTLDPDGTGPDERERERRRDLSVSVRPDGSSRVTAELDAICTEALLTTLDTAARPVPAGESGDPDRRTAGQRRHDGLRDALLLLLRTGELPESAGVSTTILLTMTVDQLERRTGLVTTGHGATVPLGQALTLAADARVIPIVFGRAREIAAYGSAQRLFTEGQRLAMMARDQGCSFPGCDVGPQWCESHHVTDFSLTRRTCVDDGTLVCGYHHREHGPRGWTSRMINGRPHWVPPVWIDPEQRPRRNTRRDVPVRWTDEPAGGALQSEAPIPLP